MKKYFIYPISLLSVLILSSCGPKIYIPDDTPDLKVQESFLNSNIDSFRASDGFINKGLINIAWNENNVLFKENNTLSLQITDNPNNYGGTSYYGGEYHSNDLYSYGDYAISLKAVDESGIRSSFFTYIGNDDNQAKEGIEILFNGNDTTSVTFNYSIKGNGEHKYNYNLGFDSSKEYHTYGFRWNEDNIIYFVDLKPVYIVDKSPTSEARIYMNYYCENNATVGWIERPSETASTKTLDIKWVSYLKLN